MPEDDYQIQRVITAYSLLTGRGDWQPVLALFTEDGVWEIPHLGLRFAGHEAIRAALAQLSADLEWVFQHNAPALIDVTGDTATARSGIRELGKRKGRDDSVEYCGIYADTLVRTRAGWKFVRRVFEGGGDDERSAGSWALTGHSIAAPLPPTLPPFDVPPKFPNSRRYDVGAVHRIEV